jgi:hypothetical protein
LKTAPKPENPLKVKALTSKIRRLETKVADYETITSIPQSKVAAEVKLIRG